MYIVACGQTEHTHIIQRERDIYILCLSIFAQTIQLFKKSPCHLNIYIIYVAHKHCSYPSCSLKFWKPNCCIFHKQPVLWFYIKAVIFK